LYTFNFAKVEKVLIKTNGEY